MRIYTILLAFLVLGTGSVFSQKTFGVYDLMNLKFVGATAISPNGKKVAYTVMKRRPLKEGAGSNFYELHVLDIKTGTSKFYFSHKGSISGLSWKPNTETITFLASLNEGKQVYGIDLNGGSYYPITQIKHSFGGFDWHPSGNSLA
ncbi:MAG: hypothetical protein ACPGLV_19070, partial [Bacteroidia bacterium]